MVCLQTFFHLHSSSPPTLVLDHVSDKAARNFIDIVGGRLDDDAQEHLRQLKEEYIPASGLTNVINYKVDSWDAERGIAPETNAEHRGYISKLCADFESAIRTSIDDGEV